MKINGKEYLSPQEQLFENTKDIEELKQVIKPEYTTSASLTEASVTVALNTTNAPEGTTEGWLLTHDGLKFKITGGDETNLLLEFYANLKGPQGEQGPSGAELEIDDSETSATKVWSSQKVASELASAGKQYYQHNIRLTRQTGRYTDNFIFCLPIINDSIEELTQDDVLDYLQNSGYTYNSNNGTYIQNYMPMTGWEYDSNTSNTVYFYGIMYYSSGRIYTKSSVGSGDQDASIYTFEDNVIPFP